MDSIGIMGDNCRMQSTKIVKNCKLHFAKIGKNCRVEVAKTRNLLLNREKFAQKNKAHPKAGFNL